MTNYAEHSEDRHSIEYGSEISLPGTTAGNLGMGGNQISPCCKDAEEIALNYLGNGSSEVEVSLVGGDLIEEIHIIAHDGKVAVLGPSQADDNIEDNGDHSGFTVEAAIQSGYILAEANRGIGNYDVKVRKNWADTTSEEEEYPCGLATSSTIVPQDKKKKKKKTTREKRAGICKDS